MAVENYIPELWSASILENFKETEIIAPTVSRDYEGEAQRGNVVRITSFTTPTIVDYATGTDGARTINPEELNDSSQHLPIDQERAFSFYVDDIDARQSAGTFDAVTRDAAGGLVETMETHLADLLLSEGTDIDGGDSETVTTGDEAFDKVLQMRTELSRLKVPAGNRTLLVNPEFSRLLLGADSKLTNVDTSGDPQGLRDATLGNLLGFRVLESALLSPGQACAVGYHQSAVGHVAQLEKTEALRAQNKFADIMRGLAVYGSKVLRPTAIQYWQEVDGS